MVVKLKLVLKTSLVVGCCSASFCLFAQSKLTPPTYELINESLSKNNSEKPQALSQATGLEFSTVKIEGNGAQEKQNLQNKEIPAAFVSLGNRQPTYGIVVEKNKHRLTVYQLQEDGNYSVVKSYKAITGKEKGDKKFSGDNRTPEGIYFVVGQKKADELFRRWGKSANKYGPQAFVLDYPNIFDKRLHKTGYGIWLHGVDKETRILTPFDTEGCVALANNDVLDISNYISAWETPVVIVDEMQSSSLLHIQDQRSKVLNMLEVWRTSWESSNINTYLEFYSDNFYSLGKTKSQWQNFKQTLAKIRDNSIQVQISEPKILAFKNQLLVEFLQKYSSKGKTDFGRKFLYLQQEGDEFKIIAEKWYPIKNKLELELAVARNNALTNERQAKN